MSRELFWLTLTVAMTALFWIPYILDRIFWARLAHVVVYTMGIPMARTAAFTTGWIAQAMLVLAIFKVI